jgi:hypothetical protein
MDCETARYLIDPLHDDELDVASAAALVGHLEGCGSCRAEEARILSRRSSLATLRPGTCPAELRRRIAASCGGSSERRRGSRSAKGRFAWPLLFVSVAGVVAGAALTRTGALPLRMGRHLNAEPGAYSPQEAEEPLERAPAVEPMEVEGGLLPEVRPRSQLSRYDVREERARQRAPDRRRPSLRVAEKRCRRHRPRLLGPSRSPEGALYPRGFLADVVSVVSMTSGLQAGR